MQESYEIYKNKKIDFNFAMRLHSIILSEVYNIEYIGISYTKKTENLLKDLEKNLKNQKKSSF
jgi:polysaccharide pyruvyl transferase WcaK-like protein